MSEQDGSSPRGGAPRPPALVLAVVVAAVEALALVAVALYAVVTTLSGAGSLLGVVPLVVLPVAIAAGLVLSARGLLRGRRWARAPVITWQLFQAVLLQPTLGTPSLRPWAVLALVAAAAAVVALLTPAALRATSSSQAPPLT